MSRWRERVLLIISGHSIRRHEDGDVDVKEGDARADAVSATK